jgi:hypothetical protein
MKRRKLMKKPGPWFNCPEHGRTKARVDRRRLRTGRWSWRSRCLICYTLTSILYRAKNKGKRAAYWVTYYAKNRERTLARVAEWYKANRGYVLARQRTLQDEAQSSRSAAQNRVGNIAAQAQARTSLSGMTGLLAPLL